MTSQWIYFWNMRTYWPSNPGKRFSSFFLFFYNLLGRGANDSWIWNWFLYKVLVIRYGLYYFIFKHLASFNWRATHLIVLVLMKWRPDIIWTMLWSKLFYSQNDIRYIIRSMFLLYSWRAYQHPFSPVNINYGRESGT